MLLTSVVLILQETLEAALLISLLSVMSRQRGFALTWLVWGLVAGLGLGWLYAGNMALVSNWFDYVGQEVVNAVLHVSIALVIVGLAWTLGDPRSGSSSQLFLLRSAFAVALAITREGSEIMVYLGGFMAQPEKLPAVLAGSGIGAGIGLSIGALLYYGMLSLRGNWRVWTPMVLLALYSGNMLAQGVLQLIQADLVAGGPTLWDSSVLLPEHTVAGRLLYALVGYESQPSMLQAVAYACGSITALALFQARRRSR